jgi:hypothetical protein
MKRAKPLVLLLFVLLTVLMNCESPTEEQGANKVVLSGQVLNEETQDPLEGAVVRVLNISPDLTAFTDASGKYQLEFEIENTTEVSYRFRSCGSGKNSRDSLSQVNPNLIDSQRFRDRCQYYFIFPICPEHRRSGKRGGGDCPPHL